MAVLPVIANCYRVAWEWTGPAGITSANVVHFLSEGTDAEELATAIDTDWQSPMFAVTSGSMRVGQLKVTPLDGTSSTLDFTTDSAHWSGGGSGDPVPAVAQVVKLLTGVRGRSHRGRIFLPGISEGSISDGSITSSDVTAQSAAWAAFEAALASRTPSIHLAVASYKLATADPVTAVVVQRYCATQRRRQSRLNF